MAIEDFTHKGLKELFVNGRTRRVDVRLQAKLTDLLDLLDAATNVRDLHGVCDFHALRGDRRGQYAMTVTRNWRLTFSFDKGEARGVDLEDYH